MSKRKVQWVILCEDKQQASFVRYFLVRIGIHPQKMRFRFSPEGKGAGEQFVRENYSYEVRVYRSKKNYLSVGLITIIDADTNTVEQRLRQLDESLADNSLPIRQADEKIAVFVPKRNIETWIHYLKGETVDEDREKPYSKLQDESDCKYCVEELQKQCHNGSFENNAPPSLLRAADEMRRIRPE